MSRIKRSVKGRGKHHQKMVLKLRKRKNKFKGLRRRSVTTKRTKRTKGKRR